MGSNFRITFWGHKSAYQLFRLLEVSLTEVMEQFKFFWRNLEYASFRTPNRHKRSLNFIQQEFNRSARTFKGTRALEFQLESLAAFGRIQGLQHGPISLRIFKGTFCISGEEQRELEPIPGSSYERSTKTSYSRGKELFKNP